MTPRNMTPDEEHAISGALPQMLGLPEVDELGFRLDAQVIGEPSTMDLPALPRAPILGGGYVPTGPQLSAEEAQYLAAGLGAPFRPISFDPDLVKRLSATHRPDASSAAVQGPIHTGQMAAHLSACAASLADIAHQLALCAAALHQTPAGTAPAPQSVPGGPL